MGRSFASRYHARPYSFVAFLCGFLKAPRVVSSRFYAGYFTVMPSQLELSGKIASYAQMVRDLEKILTTTTDARKTMERLQEARQQLDEALLDLARVGRDE